MRWISRSVSSRLNQSKHCAAVTAVTDPARTRQSYATHYSTASTLTYDYRAPEEKPFAYEYNGAFVYRHPFHPEAEDVFKHGERF